MKKLKCTVHVSKILVGSSSSLSIKTNTTGLLMDLLDINGKAKNNYHLYFVSKNHPKLLDWFLTPDGEIKLCSSIMFNQVSDDATNSSYDLNEVFKVEATSNLQLFNTAKIPNSFFNKFFELQGDIKEVFIELQVTTLVKLRPDRTVIVSAVKDTYTSDEFNSMVEAKLQELVEDIKLELDDKIPGKLINQILLDFKDKYNNDFTQTL